MLTKRLIHEEAAIHRHIVPVDLLVQISRNKAILRDRASVKARLIGVQTTLVNGELLSQFDECATIGRIPGEFSRSSNAHLLKDGLVVEERNRVPVLWQPIIFALVC